jgi:hypothetical protein
MTELDLFEQFKQMEYIFEQETAEFTPEQRILFLSFSDGKSRAYVVKGKGLTWEDSWQDAKEHFRIKAKSVGMVPIWLKLDWVTEIHEHSYAEFLDYISGIKTNYLREGIAFDQNFNLAFMEQEVNANVFIHELKKSGRKTMAWKNVNFYIKRNTGHNLLLDDKVIHNIYTFSTRSLFHDGANCFLLNDEPLSNGTRIVEELTRNTVLSVIDNAAGYLASQVDEDGKFQYGYFPCFDKSIDHYNILRHASSTYSLVEAYEVNRDVSLVRPIELALEYLMDKGVETLETPDGLERAFVVEHSSDNEIKLGANAAAILAITKYTSVFKDDKYVAVAELLASGIEYFQNDDGSFVHVYNYPELSVKEENRIIYYDGEAAFALMRMYGMDRNHKWLELVNKAFDYFIANEYWKNSDHWLSYCSYELFQTESDPRILEFNLKNADGILDFCLMRETTFPTLLELLLATNKALKYAKSLSITCDYMAQFDEVKLLKAIEHRARYQLNGFMYPEVAMYFKVPEHILWGFFIRHHSFRVRIDDVEHNLSGYCGYLDMI